MSSVSDALRKLADLADAGVITLTTVNTTYGLELADDRMPVRSTLAIQVMHDARLHSRCDRIHRTFLHDTVAAFMQLALTDKDVKAVAEYKPS